VPSISCGTIGDVDRDGDNDIVLGGDIGGYAKLLLNNGTATPFQGVAAQDIPASVVLALKLADLDHDGDLDLVTGSYLTQSDPNAAINELFLNDGSATPFTESTRSFVGGPGESTSEILAEDFDHDGRLDLIFANDGAPSHLYLNNGGPNPFENVEGHAVSTDSTAVIGAASADFNRDGSLDVVKGNRNTASEIFFNGVLSQHFNGVSAADITGDAHTTLGIAVGDVDGDGRLDVLIGNDGAKSRVYLHDGRRHSADSHGLPMAGERRSGRRCASIRSISSRWTTRSTIAARNRKSCHSRRSASSPCSSTCPSAGGATRRCASASRNTGIRLVVEGRL
jgi:hypothetical protein